MFFLLPGWVIAVAAIGMAELQIYDRAARPAAYRAAKNAGEDEMGWFVWLLGIAALPITIVVYVIGSIVGSAKKVG